MLTLATVSYATLTGYADLALDAHNLIYSAYLLGCAFFRNLYCKVVRAGHSVL